MHMYVEGILNQQTHHCEGSVSRNYIRLHWNINLDVAHDVHVKIGPHLGTPSRGCFTSFTPLIAVRVFCDPG